MQSIALQIERRPHGFDHLRLWMALWVIVLHSFALTTDVLPQLTSQGGYRILAAVPVPVFFAVSGFLISQSAVRNSPAVFAAYRLLRVMPALAAVVFLGVFVAGPLVTSLSVGDYFSSPKTWSQLAILVGVTKTQAPGFDGHNFLDFNGSLWTIPWEMGCYLWLGLFTALGIIQKRGPAVLLVCGLSVASILQALTKANGLAFVSPLFMVTCFAAGAMLHTLRDRVVVSLPAGLAALALAMVMIGAGGAQFSALPLSYAAIAIGLQPMAPLKADWSYGVYISAFPMQQWLSNESWGRIWWVNAGLAGLWATTYAAASWRFIEQPALRLKPKVHDWLAAIKRTRALQGTTGVGA